MQEPAAFASAARPFLKVVADLASSSSSPSYCCCSSPCCGCLCAPTPATLPPSSTTAAATFGEGRLHGAALEALVVQSVARLGRLGRLSKVDKGDALGLSFRIRRQANREHASEAARSKPLPEVVLTYVVWQITEEDGRLGVIDAAVGRYEAKEVGSVLRIGLELANLALQLLVLLPQPLQSIDRLEPYHVCARRASEDDLRPVLQRTGPDERRHAPAVDSDAYLGLQVDEGGADGRRIAVPQQARVLSRDGRVLKLDVTRRVFADEHARLSAQIDGLGNGAILAHLEAEPA